MTLEPARLETERFGVDVRRAHGKARDFCSLREDAVQSGADLVIARCDAADWTATHAIEDAGGRLMDTHLSYVQGVHEAPPPEDGPVRVRAAGSEDVDAVGRLAQVAFEDYSGHFHADPRLAERATDVYVDWARRSVLEPEVADRVLIAYDAAERPLGFSTLRFGTGEAIGVLDAVAPDARGRGVYTMLGRARIRAAREAGAERIVVRTHLTNLGARRGLARLGFLPLAQEHTFHLWLTATGA